MVAPSRARCQPNRSNALGLMYLQMMPMTASIDPRRNPFFEVEHSAEAISRTGNSNDCSKDDSRPRRLTDRLRSPQTG